MWMNLKNMLKKPDTRGYRLYDSIYGSIYDISRIYIPIDETQIDGCQWLGEVDNRE